jgi:steroid 5-alpha reductase family enzyme
MLPVSYLLDSNHPPGFGPWAIVGASVWLVGLVIEAVADAQRSAFRSKDENRDAGRPDRRQSVLTGTRRQTLRAA